MTTNSTRVATGYARATWLSPHDGVQVPDKAQDHKCYDTPGQRLRVGEETIERGYWRTPPSVLYAMRYCAPIGFSA